MTEKTIDSSEGMAKLKTEDQENYADEHEQPQIGVEASGKVGEAEGKYGRTLAELMLSMKNSDTLGSAYSLACLLHQRKEVERCESVLSSRTDCGSVLKALFFHA